MRYGRRTTAAGCLRPCHGLRLLAKAPAPQLSQVHRARKIRPLIHDQQPTAALGPIQTASLGGCAACISPPRYPRGSANARTAPRRPAAPRSGCGPVPCRPSTPPRLVPAPSDCVPAAGRPRARTLRIRPRHDKLARRQRISLRAPGARSPLWPRGPPRSSAAAASRAAPTPCRRPPRATRLTGGTRPGAQRRWPRP